MHKIYVEDIIDTASKKGGFFMAKLRYLGHSAFYVEGYGLKALIDPFLKGNPQAAAKPEDFTDINYIFLTHGHGDHIGSTIEIAKRTGATVFAVTELAAYLAEEGVKTEGMQVGARAKFTFGRVKLTPAWHGSPYIAGSESRYAGIACGYVIEIDGKKLYHSGDTGLTTEMELLAEENISAALLPIGGYYTMDIDDAVRAVKMIKPKVVVPMHYNTFPKIKADPEEFARKVREAMLTPKVLAPGEWLEL
jgi:L-ascorbate metabolism protein UlaG (beta-lactamase superfamily)